MFELDYLTQRLTFARATDTTNAAADRRLRTDLRERRRRAAGRDRRAARRRARGVRAGRPRRRPAGRRRRRRPLGGRPRRRAADRRPRTPDGRAGARCESDRPERAGALAARRLDRAAGQRVPARTGPPGPAVDRRTGHGRDGRRRRCRQDGPAAGGPVRLARLVGHRGRHRSGGRRGDQRGSLAHRRGARGRGARRRGPRGRSAAGDARRRRGGARGRRRRAHRAGHARRDASHPDHRSMDAAVDAIAPGLHAGSTVIFETTLPVGDTRGPLRADAWPRRPG